MAISDEKLLLAYLEGDESGMGELIDRFRRPLFSVILRMVGDAHDAEDIFQETFFRVLRGRDQFDAERKFSSWLFAIAVNLCRDHLRKDRRSLESGQDELPEVAGSEDPESDSWRREVRAAVESALQSLPPEQREVFLLREYGGLSFKEIAELSGVNINTALGRMHMAVKKLRAELEHLREETQ